MPVTLKQDFSRRRKLTLIVKHRGAEHGVEDYVARAGTFATSAPSVFERPLTLGLHCTCVWPYLLLQTQSASRPQTRTTSSVVLTWTSMLQSFTSPRGSGDELQGPLWQSKSAQVRLAALLKPLACSCC